LLILASLSWVDDDHVDPCDGRDKRRSNHHEMSVDILLMRFQGGDALRFDGRELSNKLLDNSKIGSLPLSRR
jgi:hypothetical protein